MRSIVYYFGVAILLLSFIQGVAGTQVIVEIAQRHEGEAWWWRYRPMAGIWSTLIVHVAGGVFLLRWQMRRSKKPKADPFEFGAGEEDY